MLRGVRAVRADAAAAGLRPVNLWFDEIGAADRERLVEAAAGIGIDCLSGPDWVLWAGPLARLAAAIRPGTSPLPTSLAERVGAALQDREPTAWRTAVGRVSLDRPVVVGILNTTPDSFSDGGRFLDPAAAAARVDSMFEDGMDVLDIGAESTRPGARPVPVDEEWSRLAPVLRWVVARHPGLPVSIDTTKAEVARRALAEGAWIINDVSGLRLDPEMSEVCAETGAGLIVMHSRGRMSELASYTHAPADDVVAAVGTELAEAVVRAEDAGIERDCLVIDPGLGFGKRPDQTFALIRRLEELAFLSLPIMVGPSRKRFLAGVGGDPDAATAGAAVEAFERGARLFRVHAVGPTRAALDVAHELRSH